MRKSSYISLSWIHSFCKPQTFNNSIREYDHEQHITNTCPTMQVHWNLWIPIQGSKSTVICTSIRAWMNWSSYSETIRLGEAVSHTWYYKKIFIDLVFCIAHDKTCWMGSWNDQPFSAHFIAGTRERRLETFTVAVSQNVWKQTLSESLVENCAVWRLYIYANPATPTGLGAP